MKSQIPFKVPLSPKKNEEKSRAFVLTGLEGAKGAPPPIENLRAVPAFEKVVLSWTAPSRKGQNVAKWIVALDTESNVIATINDLTTLSYTAHVPDQANHIFYVFAQNAQGQKSAAKTVLSAATHLTAFENTPLNAAQTDNATGTILSQSGTTTKINVAAFQMQYGNGLLSYNSGSVDPGAYGVYYVYFSDPNYQGGAVAFLTTQNYSHVYSNNGFVLIGQITTVGGGGGTGGGGGGGINNPCFSPNVLIRRKNNSRIQIGNLKRGDLILTNTGKLRPVRRVIRTPYKGPMLDMGGGELVTPSHHFVIGERELEARNLWTRVLDYEGIVVNLEIETEVEAERTFVLGNGMPSHNMRIGC